MSGRQRMMGVLGVAAYGAVVAAVAVATWLSITGVIA